MWTCMSFLVVALEVTAAEGAKSGSMRQEFPVWGVAFCTSHQHSRFRTLSQANKATAPSPSPWEGEPSTMQTPLTHILSTPSNSQNSPLTYLIVIQAKRFVKQILPQRPERRHCQCFPLSADELDLSGAFKYVLEVTAMCRRSREGMTQCFTICYKVSLNPNPSRREICTRSQDEACFPVYSIIFSKSTF